MTCMDKRCLKYDLDITVDTWKYLFYFKLSQNIFVPWVYVKIKQCAHGEVVGNYRERIISMNAPQGN